MQRTPRKTQATTNLNIDLDRFGMMDERSMNDDTLLIVNAKYGCASAVDSHLYINLWDRYLRPFQAFTGLLISDVTCCGYCRDDPRRNWVLTLVSMAVGRSSRLAGRF